MYIPLAAYEINNLMRQPNLGDTIEHSAFQGRLTELKNQVPFDFQLDGDEVLTPLITAMLNLATQKYLGAAYGGSSNDGGASQVISELAGIIVGYQMAKEGCLLEPYSTVVSVARRHQDPEYQKYKELHKKFRGVDPN